jgi:hypothetical protein
MSEMWMIDHADQFLSEQEIKKAIAAGVAKMAQGMPKQKQIQMLTEILNSPLIALSETRMPQKSETRLLKRLPSKPNILPVYVRAENPFDFENQDVQGVTTSKKMFYLRSMRRCDLHYQRPPGLEWSGPLKSLIVQEAIQKPCH